MLGKTHEMGGMFISVIGFTMLKDRGLLLPDVNIGIQWLAMYPFCIIGSKLSDYDHEWSSCPDKDIIAYSINKVLHITEPVYRKLDSKLTGKQKRKSKLYRLSKFLTARHRSWQTHSDLTLISMLALLNAVMNNKFSFLGKVDVAFLSIMLTGLCMGIVAHFVLDLLTPEGVWNTPVVLINRLLLKKRIPRHYEKWHLVPKMKCFATSSDWEDFIYKLLRFLTIVSVIYLLISVLFPNQLKYLIDLLPYRIEIG